MTGASFGNQINLHSSFIHDIVSETLGKSVEETYS